QISTNTFTSTLIDIIPNRWSHLAFVFKTDSLEVYLDGERQYASAFTHQTSNSGNPIYIGSEQTNNLAHFDGRIDDIRFWDHARTVEEIKANLFQEMLGTETGLEAYFDFNEGIVGGDNKNRTAAIDKTGNGNDLTFENMNLFGGYSNYTQSALNFRIDEDEDGRPDVCDNCIPEASLTLQNTVLSGTYRARDKITLGAGLTIPIADTIILRAPEVEVLHSISSPNSTRILVKYEPCDE
ncbi:MAG: LamG domain-containing protein, partial [Bacteroidota bacterium]